MHNQFQPLEGPLEVAPPLPLATHDIKKLTLPHGLSRKPMFRLILLGLLLFILLSSLYYKQDPASHFLIPYVHSNTSRIAICLMGGARRFEVTGPTILKHVLNVFPEADLFVHSNLDKNSFKLSLLRSAPRVTEVRIRRPVELHESEEIRRVITANFSPNGLQLCDGSGPWQEGWEEIFNKVAGNAATNVRLRIKEMKMEECVQEMEGLKRKAERWNGPDPIEICNLGLPQVGKI